MSSSTKPNTANRRDFLRTTLRGLGFVAVGAVGAAAIRRAGRQEIVWQIDPHKCTQCGRCATECVLNPSAVKCVHAYDVCGYCDLCGGYHQPKAKDHDTAAENRLCPTGAILRTYIEEPYFEYSILEDLCIGCAKCVKGCTSFGNGSLYLQVRHHICLNCNECRIARACPSGAFVRVRVATPYLPKGATGGEGAAKG